MRPLVSDEKVKYFGSAFTRLATNLSGRNVALMLTRRIFVRLMAFHYTRPEIKVIHRRKGTMTAFLNERTCYAYIEVPTAEMNFTTQCRALIPATAGPIPLSRMSSRAKMAASTKSVSR